MSSSFPHLGFQLSVFLSHVYFPQSRWGPIYFQSPWGIHLRIGEGVNGHEANKRVRSVVREERGLPVPLVHAGLKASYLTKVFFPKSRQRGLSLKEQYQKMGYKRPRQPELSFHEILGFLTCLLGSSLEICLSPESTLWATGAPPTCHPPTAPQMLQVLNLLYIVSPSLSRSPVVPGGVVAMDRHYFQNTGAYDPLMSLRGGENLELSLKVLPGPREAQVGSLEPCVRSQLGSQG